MVREKSLGQSSAVCVINASCVETTRSWEPAINGDVHRVVVPLILVIIYNF